jgi:acetyl-CoA carboxylase beta subunit
VIITSQHVHARNWMQCPRCEGGTIFTERDRREGAICNSCDNRGEVPRFRATKVVDNSSFYERQAGA